MKKRITCLFLAVLMLVCSFAMTGCGKSSGEIANEARNGVVRVAAVNILNQLVGTGTAFGVGEAGEEATVFVTNWHVVYDGWYEDTSTGDVFEANCKIYILKNNSAYDPVYGTLDTAQCIPCEILYISPNGIPDIAVIEAAETIPGRVALPLLGDDDEVEQGQNVYALGYPGSSDLLDSSVIGTKMVAGVDDVTITDGVVSRMTTAKYEDMKGTKVIQHTAQINHGNSGGPLINEKGAVIGVNTWLWGQNSNTGDDNSYGAVRISHVREILDDEGIEYDVYSGVNWLMIGIIAGIALLIIIVVVIIIVVSSNNKRKAEAERQKAAAAAAAAAAATSRSYTPAQTPTAPDYRPRLQCLSGAFAGKRFSLENSVRIGRDPSKNDLVFPANTQGVSSVHCVLMVDNNTVWLKDLGSTYGTYVSGGRRLAANEAVQLHMGDKFWLGSENEVFVVAPKGGI